MSIEYENQLNNYIRMFENELRNLTATPNDWLKFYIQLATITNWILKNLF